MPTGGDWYWPSIRDQQAAPVGVVLMEPQALACDDRIGSHRTRLAARCCRDHCGSTPTADASHPCRRRARRRRLRQRCLARVPGVRGPRSVRVALRTCARAWRLGRRSAWSRPGCSAWSWSSSRSCWERRRRRCASTRHPAGRIHPRDGCRRRVGGPTRPGRQLPRAGASSFLLPSPDLTRPAQNEQHRRSPARSPSRYCSIFRGGESDLSRCARRRHRTATRGPSARGCRVAA